MSTAEAFAADGWEADSPGTLALVIGVSRYPFLARDPDGCPTPHNKYGLSELSVSALTAYRFATWLRESYQNSASPLVRCWLLASPTDAELQKEPGLAGVAEPTFRNCEDAIWDWYSTALRLPAAHAQKSRLVLFYSGHGLERTLDEQLLLPSDYLERGLVNRAINARDLRQALAACGVPQQLFLIDACRNDHPRLRDLGFSLNGTQVLNPVDSSRALPNLDSPVLYGTSSGQQAFAPRTVRDGLTLFGQALLSGLTAPPADSLERDSDRCVMVVNQLQKYMNARIAELLLTYGSDAQQRVIMGGQSIGAFVVSELPCDAAVPNDLPSVRDSEQRGRTASVTFVDAVSGEFVGDDKGEDPFGDPVMAQLWSRRRLRLSDDADGTTPELTLVRVDRRGTSLYDIVFRIDSDPRPSVLTLAAETQNASHAFDCHLPWVGPGALHSLHLSRDDAGAIVQVEADLDLENTGLLGRTAEAWRAYREQSATVAAGLLSDDMFSTVVDGGEPSPLLVVVGCFLRLVAGRPIERAWLETAAVVWPRWSDPTVLLVESARRERGPSVDVNRLAALPIPQTAGVMALAWRLLVDQGIDGPIRLSGQTDLEMRLSRIVPWTQPGSMFPVILTPAPKTDPGI
jgi:hypothetical protein